MNEWEQLEAFVEARIVTRKATRREVEALRSYRREPTARARARLALAVLDTFLEPLVPPMKAMAEAVARAMPQLQELGRLLAAVEADQVAATDLGEFDNRAHDWLRNEGNED